jgi:hypothetical protein
MTKPRTPRPATEPLSLHPAEIIIDRLRLLATRKQDTWWDIGVLLNELALRSKSASANPISPTLRRQLGISPQQMRTWQTLAQRFPRSVAMRIGPERLGLLLDYLEQLPLAATWADPTRADIIVNDTDVLSFDEASDADLKQAQKHVSQNCQKFLGDIVVTQRKIQDRLASLLPDHAPSVKVQGTGLCQSDNQLSILGIAPENLESVGRALTKIAKEMKLNRSPT